jgi:tRNA pseudouridine55 synthase
VDKPAGPTSHDVVGAVRRVLDTRRVGHAGTLDPPASGLLVVLVGRATRLMQFIGLLPKRYRGLVRFGHETTTDDAAGTPTLSDESGATPWRDDARLGQALAHVQAQPTQVPPPVSAKKVEGERAYKRVWRGENVTLEPVPVTIHRLEGRAAGEREVEIDVECSAGTYIRAIARDLGRALGTRAHLAALRRTGIGHWDVSDALPFDDALPHAAPDALRPLEEAVRHLPRVDLDADAARRFKFGQKLPSTAAFELAAVFEGEALIGIAGVKDGLLCPSVGLAS